MSDETNSYPYLPMKAWWTLRERFRRTLPGTVDANYLSSALGISTRSAQNNVLPGLRSSGLINEEGKPTDRAVKWRDDAHYAEVCEAIRQDVYPDGLLDLAPRDSADKDEVERWFANTGGVGQAQASNLTRFYLLLCSGDASQASPGEANKQSGTKATKKAEKPAKKASAKKTPKTPDPEEKDDNKSEVRNSGPTLHLNVQVHISPEMTAEQIDQIFESMARHLKNFS